MLTIRPFRALRYGPEYAKDLTPLLTPPYDVISPEDQERYYRQHPKNIIRLELGRESATDTPADNRYTRAAATLRGWLAEGTLVHDPVPAIYVIRETYVPPGGSHEITRCGFMAATKLVPFSDKIILPHERTLDGPKVDRFKLFTACNAHLSQIFVLFQDADGAVRKILNETAGTPPLAQGTIGSARVTVHAITGTAQTTRLAALMAPKNGFIADGHHRYETMLAIARDYAQKTGYQPGADSDFGLIHWVPFEDEGLTIFPTHRLLFGLAPGTLDALESQAAAHFDIAPTPAGLDGGGLVRHLEAQPRVCFAILRPGAATRVFTLKPGTAAREIPGHEAVRELDVTVLHTLIIERYLGVSRDAQAKQTNLRYIKSNQGLVDAIVAGEGQLGILMRATRLEQLRDVALAGEVMPQKSTYFYPKVPAGLLLNPIGPIG